MLVLVGLGAEIARGGGLELLLARAVPDVVGPLVQAGAHLREMALDVVGDAEVDQRKPLRVAALDLVEGRVPGLEVDLRRRRGWEDEPGGLDADAGRVARVERAVAVQVADVVRGVARGGEAFEPEHLGADDADVLLRHRCELAPERVELLAVEPARASLEPLGVDEVRRADLRYVHLQLRVLADEHAGRARVVEVDVREQQVPHVLQLQVLVREPRFQLRDAGRRPAVEQRRPV